MRFARIDKVVPTLNCPEVDKPLRDFIGGSFEVKDVLPDGGVRIRIGNKIQWLRKGEYTDMENCPTCDALFEYAHGSRTIVCPQGHEYANEREEK